MHVQLRPRCAEPGSTDPATEAFLYELYTSTRADEMALVDWSAEEREKFLGFQFFAQEQAYINDYPGCQDQIIAVDGQPAGRLLLWRSENAICLLDIALLPQYRSLGIGTQLVRSVMALGEAEGKLVWLYVLFTNTRAEQLYTRLGFTRRELAGAFYVMDWAPPAAGPADVN